MVVLRSSSLVHILDDQIPQPALFNALLDKWVLGEGGD